MKNILLISFAVLVALNFNITLSHNVELLLAIPFGSSPHEVESFLMKSSFTFKKHDSIYTTMLTNKERISSYYEYDFQMDSVFNKQDTILNFRIYFFEDKLYKISYTTLGYYPDNDNGDKKLLKLKEYLNINYGKPKIRTEKNIKEIFGIKSRAKISNWGTDKYEINLSERDHYILLPEITITDKATSSNYQDFLKNNVKTLFTVKRKIYKDVTDKAEISRMGSGGVFEKYIGDRIEEFESYNIDRASIHSMVLSNISDTLYFSIIDVESNVIIYKEDLLPVQGKYEIPTEAINSSIQRHVRGGRNQESSCKTWENDYKCNLVILIKRKGKVAFEKYFTIYTTIG
jgi:hypothetical protein